jgi:hypothetical protein
VPFFFEKGQVALSLKTRPFVELVRQRTISFTASYKITLATSILRLTLR